MPAAHFVFPCRRPLQMDQKDTYPIYSGGFQYKKLIRSDILKQTLQYYLHLCFQAEITAYHNYYQNADLSYPRYLSGIGKKGTCFFKYLYSQIVN